MTAMCYQILIQVLLPASNFSFMMVYWYIYYIWLGYTSLDKEMPNKLYQEHDIEYTETHRNDSSICNFAPWH